MKVIIWVIGLLCVIFGLISILKPQTVKALFQKFLTKNFQFLGIIIFIIGIFLIAASFKAKVFWYVFILGILACFKGIFYLLKPRLAQNLVNKWVNMGENGYKLCGLLSYTLGIFLLIWGR